MSGSRYSKASAEAADNTPLLHCPPSVEGQATTIDNIPNELIQPTPRLLDQSAIGNYLPLSDLVSLSLVSRRFRDLTRESIKRQQVQILLQQVAYGDKDKVEAILRHDPSLLLLASTVTDYSWRTYRNFTPLQLAYAVGDVAIYPELGLAYEGMVERLMRYFDQLPGGREGALKQIQGKFPEGLVERPAFDFNPLVDVIVNSTDQEVEDVLALRVDVMSEGRLWKALEAFRKAFTLLSQAEERYNPNHVMRAFETYEREFDRLEDWNRRDLFFRQVIGYVQRYLPACDAQVFAQWVYHVVEEREASRSLLIFRFGGGAIFPLLSSPPPFFGLGYKWGANGEGVPVL